ncbi:MAG: peptidoglycan DD-metalloendopeptidase family protein [Candidatus Omnitrophica bacterium]|nr:peptidoglycan DD-metalloendopeptidase family protein [Candidatus Omnitrophota bacterium]
MRSRQSLYSGLIAILSLFLIGCATTAPTPSATSVPAKTQGTAGNYYKAKKGDTLWRIAKKYNVDLEELAKLNHIPDAAKIETGQLLMIPPARSGGYGDLTKANGSEDFIWPLKGEVIGRFGERTNNILNKGLNIRAPYGEEVVASRSGIVSYCSENLRSFGRTVIIDHGDGFLTVYARNAQLFVKTGDKVAQGVAIAKVGSVGKDRTAFLHFEIRKGHKPQNPYYYLAN